MADKDNTSNNVDETAVVDSTTAANDAAADQGAAPGTAAAAAAPPSDASAAAANAQATADQMIDFDSLSIEDQRHYLEHGSLPEKKPGTATAKPAAAKPADKAADKTDKSAAAAAAVDADADDAANKEGDSGADAGAEDDPFAEFKFTENSDDATFESEMTELLETVELPAPLQAIFDRQAKRITDLSTAVAAKPEASTERVVKAFDRLVEFRQDPETKSFIPDTTEFVSLLSSDYKNELPQLIIDLNAQPSEKYPGMPRFKEFIQDYFQLPKDAMEHLDYFFQSGGKFPVPPVVPNGITKDALEAFWTSPDRQGIEQKAEALVFTITQDQNASDAEKAKAREDLTSLNKQLLTIQAGINAQNEKVKFAENQKQTAIEAIQERAAANYIATADGLKDSFAEKLSKSMGDLFGDTAARINAASYTSLIENALSDDVYAGFAQKELERAGIKFDWAKGKEALERLGQIELEIEALTSEKRHPRAIDNARSKKADILKEITRLDHELSGKVVEVVTSGHGKALTKKIEGAKKQVVIRPKAKAAGITGQPRGKSFNDMSREEIQKEIGNMNPYERAVRGGDPNAFS